MKGFTNSFFSWCQLHRRETHYLQAKILSQVILSITVGTVPIRLMNSLTASREIGPAMPDFVVWLSLICTSTNSGTHS